MAADEKEREEFVNSLRAAFARASKPGLNLADPSTIVTMMQAGEEITSYIGSGIIGSSNSAFVWFVPTDGNVSTTLSSAVSRAPHSAFALCSPAVC